MKHNFKFYNNVLIADEFQLQLFLLSQCSNNAHSEYRNTLLRHKPR